MRRMLQGRAGMAAAFLLGLLVATAGTATAAKLITGKQIKDGSITASDLSKAVRAQLAKAGERGPAGAPGAKGDAGAPATPAAVEAWHEVGGGPSEPAFENGWANYGNANEVTAGFYKDPFGIVHLKGILAAGPNAVIFTLPPGYRPGKNLVQLVQRGAGTALLVILADGKVQFNFGSVYTSLDGGTFRSGG